MDRLTTPSLPPVSTSTQSGVTPTPKYVKRYKTTTNALQVRQPMESNVVTNYQTMSFKFRFQNFAPKNASFLGNLWTKL